MPVTASPSDATNASLIHAQTLNTQGARQLETGQAETALETWEQAEAAYVAVGDETGILGSQLNQVQALQVLGQYRRAKSLLEKINLELQPLPDSLLKADSLRSLGIALFHLGDLQESYRVLQSSLQISQRLNGDTSITLMALGNVVRGQPEERNAIAPTNMNETSTNTDAIAFYQQAAAVAADDLIRLQVRLNLFSLLVESNQTLEALPLLAEIQPLLVNLPASRATVYAQVNLAESLMKVERDNHVETTSMAIAQLLANAIQQARSLNDSRAEAYALGQLGHLYETLHQWSEAERLTQQALQITQLIQADDIAVSWQWQLGGF